MTIGSVKLGPEGKKIPTRASEASILYMLPRGAPRQVMLLRAVATCFTDSMDHKNIHISNLVNARTRNFSETTRFECFVVHAWVIH